MCLCVFWAHGDGWAVQRRLKRSKWRFALVGRETAESCESKEPCIRWGPVQMLHGKEHFWGRHVPPHCHVSTHECNAHYSSAAAGERACPAHATNAFAAARDEKTAMRPFAKLLRTFVTYHYENTPRISRFPSYPSASGFGWKYKRQAPEILAEVDVLWMIYCLSFQRRRTIFYQNAVTNLQFTRRFYWPILAHVHQHVHPC